MGFITPLDPRNAPQQPPLGSIRRAGFSRGQDRPRDQAHRRTATSTPPRPSVQVRISWRRPCGRSTFWGWLLDPGWWVVDIARPPRDIPRIPHVISLGTLTWLSSIHDTSLGKAGGRKGYGHEPVAHFLIPLGPRRAGPVMVYHDSYMYIIYTYIICIYYIHI